MQRIKDAWRVTALVAVATMISGQAAAQGKRCGDVERLNRRYVERVRKQPALGVDYARVAKFKLASRKTSYRTGELISLDFAMLNTAEVPVFFSQELSYPSFIKLKATDEKGTEVGVFEYEVFQLGVRTNSYTLLNANGIVTGTIHLLAGCEERSLFAKAKIKAVEDAGALQDRAAFERDLFVSWGDFCLNAAGPGKYTITAEMTNEFVVGSPCEPTIKTAVGTIRSTPLTITITE